MARNLDPSCKKCRREQVKLFLKGSRCYGQKCPIDKGALPPGMHGARRSKQSEYGIRLREKQKLKLFYGLLERQFRRYYAIATRAPENTGEQLLSILERRLDNIVFRLGFAVSRKGARQLVTHGHILVNGRKCNIPSALVKVNDTITVKMRPSSLELVRNSLADQAGRRVPDFLEVAAGENPEGRMLRLPTRQDVDPNIREIREQLIIEIATR
ncbi:30S ribosomal protein S4 [Tuwongella immobilis]|uniref:Small ribosomal subunit protein uS4 n=1 Tax=Tuwongella immobilis TaxID=692036 RepID=A0A6C2YN51_9BACT|nr:30S ribosomal protein S4 [Tuwongella immobilis]VIP02711.1 30s ribosomal protein s4 : 30S ribosomal protein S4 OS=Thermoanaerobacter italicus (strain DSM 9252 / Ab9) GN=rpsD PE=3 SV=1: Ribosomal_S4: S4 [Tuwongella immobilis]VTS02223.1 30s ribosomal protein s4 : 30S ribosomal protein S4 OS=Thermoanaerobacter italicus (strain DSM 9252 / Ab9) GN=rpsD PE=3 SV=1: Ribosomal_S4: S4 [Tuwongella immobilis]